MGDRRHAPRKPVKSLAYINVNSNNGGILVNLNKAGLAMRVIDPLVTGQHVHLAFLLMLNGIEEAVEVEGQVAWTDELGLSAGIRLNDLAPPSQQLLERWLSLDGGPVGDVGIQPGATQSNQTHQPPHLEPRTAGTPPSPPVVEPVQQENAVADLRQAFAPAGASGAPAKRSAVGSIAARRVRRAAIAACGGIIVLLVGLAGIRLIRNYSAPSLGELSTFVRNVIPWASDGPSAPTVAEQPTTRRRGSKARPRRNNTQGRSLTVSAATEQQAIEQPVSEQPLTKQPVLEQPTKIVARPISRTSHIAVEGSTESRLVPAFNRRAWPDPEGSHNPASILVAQQSPGILPERRVLPVYPPVARQRSIHGSVVVQASIDRDGVVNDVRLVSGDQLLSEAVLEAVKQWRYKPVRDDSESVERESRITVHFNIFAD